MEVERRIDQYNSEENSNLINSQQLIVHRCDANMVPSLLEQRDVVELTDRDGVTSLMLSEGPVFKYLFSIGARVNRRTNGGNTVLHYGVKYPNQYSLQSLFKKGAIMRMNESGESLITYAAWHANTEAVHFLDKYTESAETVTFVRHTKRTNAVHSFVMDLREKVNAYKLLGANFLYSEHQNTIQAWSTSLSIWENVVHYPERYIQRACSCTSRIQVNTEEDEMRFAEPWNTVDEVAREVVTGLEMSRRMTKRSGSTWMQKILPCFNCPCTPSAERHSVSQIRPSHVLNEDYLIKWELLRKELQLTYRRQSVAKPSQSKNCLTLSDILLGIEPVCFVNNTQNDIDPKSHYLQHHCLRTGCAIPPRTTYRCTYSVCTVCSQTFFHFGGVHRPQAQDVVCKGCSLADNVTGNQQSDGTEQSMANRQIPRNCNSVCHTHTEVNHNQSAALNICSHCGLVSEQHPLLQRLRQSRKEAFGSVREFKSREDVAFFKNNPNAIEQQKWLIKLRFQGRNDASNILCLLSKQLLTADFREKSRIWLYALHFLRIICSSVNDLCFRSYRREFEYFIFEMFKEDYDIIIGKTFILDCLELAVDCIEEPSTRLIAVTYLSRLSLRLTSLVLLSYLPEVKFHRSPQQVCCHVDLVAKRYCQDGVSEDALSPLSQILQKLRQNIYAMNSHTATKIKKEYLSPPLAHRFISQVYRLVRLEQTAETGHGLLSLASSFIHSTFHSYFVEIYCQILTVNLLLQLGADPNLVDSGGQTVVGYVLQESFLDLERAHCLLATLLEGGAHLDAYKRPYNDGYVDETLPVFLEQNNIHPVRHGRLACLSATAIRCCGIASSNPICNTSLPKHLLTFLDLH